MMLHLIYLRIGNNNITAVTGFVLPKVKKSNGCVAVTVRWNEQTMKFCSIVDPVSRPDVQKSLVKFVTGQDALTFWCVRFLKCE